MLSYRRSALGGPIVRRSRSRNDTRMAPMRLSVDGFANFLSRKAVLATAGVATLAVVALAAFAWKAGPHPPAAEPAIRPARVVAIEYRTHMRSLMLAGTVVPRIETTLGF